MELGELGSISWSDTFGALLLVRYDPSNELWAMTLSDVLAVVGAISGIAGAVIGAVGAWYGIKAYRKTDELKALDLRITLRKSESTLKETIHELVPLLSNAKSSRTRLAAAQGNLQGGATKHWLECWEVDLTEANNLFGESTALEVDCVQFTHSELEQRLITVYKLESKINKLAKKYRDSLAEDDLGRENLRKNNQMLTEARLRKADP